MFKKSNPWAALHLLGIVAIPLGIASCEGMDGGLEAEEQGLYGKPSGGANYWNNGVFGTGATIPVCWTYNATQNKDTTGAAVPAGFPGITKIRTWTREAVEQSWARMANISFTGWNDTCVRSGKGDDADRDVNGGKIMFAFATTGDSADILGKNPNFGTMIRISTNTTYQPDYRTTSIHEMGHALGFAHEQDRPDNYSGTTPLACIRGAGNNDPGGTYLNSDQWGATRVDKGSSLCYDAQLDLSRDDVIGVQKLYGRKPSGSVVGNFGECAQSGTTTKSTVKSANCQSAARIDWYYDRTLSARDLIRSRSNTGLCMSVSSPTSSSSNVVSDTCADKDAMHFSPQNMRWRAIGGTCVYVAGTGTNTQLQIGGCGDNLSVNKERWDFFSPIGYTGGEQVGQIRLNGTNQCVTAPNATPNLGDRLRLEPCITSGDFSRQIFTMVKGTHNIRHKTLCANVLGGWPDTGAFVGLWDGCGDQANQNELFNLSGSLVSGGKCSYFTGYRGTNMVAGTCKAAPAPDARGLPVRDPQEWDLYW